VLVNTPPELAERMRALADSTQRELLVEAIRHEYAKRKKEGKP